MSDVHVSEVSLKSLMAEHLGGSASLGEIERRIARRYGVIGWTVSKTSLSRMKSGGIKTTDWQKLLAIAWALDLDLDQTGLLLRSAGKQPVHYYYRIREAGEVLLFEPWPELATLRDDSFVDQSASATTESEGRLPAARWPVKRRHAWMAAGGVVLILGVLIAAQLFQGNDSPVLAPLLSSVEASPPDAEPASVEISRSIIVVADGELWALAYSPDGTQIAVGGADNVVRFWESESGKSTGVELVGHTGPVRRLAYAPSGDQLATASEDGTIGVWDIASGERLLTIEAHNGRVRGVAFSPDGAQLASVGDDGILRRWDPLTGEQIGSDSDAGPPDTVYVTYRPDGREIATTSADFEIQLWDPATGGRTREPLASSQDWVRHLAYRPDGQQIATAGRDQTVRLFGEDDVRVLKGHTGAVNSVEYSPDGGLLVSVGADQTVRVWSTETGEEVVTELRAHRDEIREVAFRPDGRQFATVSAGGELGLWSAG